MKFKYILIISWLIVSNLKGINVAKHTVTCYHTMLHSRVTSHVLEHVKMLEYACVHVCVHIRNMYIYIYIPMVPYWTMGTSTPIWVGVHYHRPGRWYKTNSDMIFWNFSWIGHLDEPNSNRAHISSFFSFLSFTILCMHTPVCFMCHY
jgi:hypothetical protein